MAQQLILPINEHKLLVGTGSTALDQYAKVNGKDMKQFGCWTIAALNEEHGVKIWGSGNGTVIASGKDTNFGNVVVVKYPNVESRDLVEFWEMLLYVIIIYKAMQYKLVKQSQKILLSGIQGEQEKNAICLLQEQDFVALRWIEIQHILVIQERSCLLGHREK